MSIVGSPSPAVHQEHHDLETAFKGSDRRGRPPFSIRLSDVGTVIDEQTDHADVTQ